METLTVETVITPNNKLNCTDCASMEKCGNFALIQECLANKSYFGAKLLCDLNKTQHVYNLVLTRLEYLRKINTIKTANNTFRLFLPTLNNDLKAFYKYDLENTPKYLQNAIILELAITLDDKQLLKDFDFIYCNDIEITAELIRTGYDTALEEVAR